MHCFDVLFHPIDKVIFECTFDDLMKKIWCEQLVYVRTREVVGKWLHDERDQ